MTRPTIAYNSPATNPPTEGTLLDNATVQVLVDMVNEHASALDTAGVPPGTLGYETKTSGALSLAKTKTYLSITNSVAFTLADGTATGQTHEIECSAVSGTPIGSLTVATMDTAGGGASALFIFNAVGQKLSLEWNGSAWHIRSLSPAGRTTVALASTTTTGMVMNLAWDITVSGTKHGTSTHALPNGRFPGQRIHLDVITASSTPIGDLAGAYLLPVGTAATSWAHIEDVDTTIDAFWDGAAWQVVQFTAGSSSAATLS